MTIENFIENFADQLDETPIEALTPETEFRKLEDWSSLVGLSVIAMVDEEYGKTLTSDMFKASKTIQDLYNQINKGK